MISLLTVIQPRNVTGTRFIAEKAFNLFAFPSECNFSGVKFNLDLANIIKEDPERILKESTHCKYIS